MNIWKRKIGFRTACFAILILVPVFGAYFFIDILLQSRESINQAKNEVDKLSDTIKRSIECDMLEAKRENIQKIIETICEQPDIMKIRIFNKAGRIMVSADRSSIGKLVDRKAEACFGCHEDSEHQEVMQSEDRIRLYRSEKEMRMIGIINPIYNKDSCFGCHDPEKKVLGVLDVVVSLSGIDRQIRKRRKGAFIFASSALLFLSG
ncbi:MAG: hypothetical protein E3J78_08140, partial [Candidatus Cloacimonadota bacterium]